MRTFFAAAVAVFAASLVARAQEAGGKEEASTGEIKVYVGDKDGKPADVSGWSATLILEPKGMAKRTIALESNQPKEKKDAESAVDHGGQIVDMEGGYKVELVVEKGHDEHDMEHGEEDAEEGLAHFEAKTSLEIYACPMKCVAPSEKEGNCSKCGMALKESAMEFSAVVVFKTSGGTKNAKGFAWPPEIPGTYGEAVEKAEEHLRAIQALIDKGDLDRVHSVAEKISQICRKLPSMAPADDKAEIEKTCGETIALFKEIDEAADAGKKDATVKVAGEYAAKIAALKSHAKEGHDK